MQFLLTGTAFFLLRDRFATRVETALWAARKETKCETFTSRYNISSLIAQRAVSTLVAKRSLIYFLKIRTLIDLEIGV